MDTILVTGCAGFIGSSLAKKLLENSFNVIGIDNLYENYNIDLKKSNLLNLLIFPNFKFHELDIRNQKRLKTIFIKYSPIKVIHLAALTGVRASIKLPQLYRSVNVLGTENIYQISAEYGIKQFIFASSSSVYGNTSINESVFEYYPFAPKSPYAKTKTNAEKMIKTIYHKYKTPTIIIRLFSVYGPQGRPDMAPFLFTEAAFKSKIMPIYGDGKTARDYTYIDDVVDGIMKILSRKFSFEIFNIGNSHPIPLYKLIQTIEKETGKKIRHKYLPILRSEAIITYANVSYAKNKLNWEPKTDFSLGMKKFVSWYKKSFIN